MGSKPVEALALRRFGTGQLVISFEGSKIHETPVVFRRMRYGRLPVPESDQFGSLALTIFKGFTGTRVLI